MSNPLTKHDAQHAVLQGLDTQTNSTQAIRSTVKPTNVFVKEFQFFVRSTTCTMSNPRKNGQA